MKKMIFAATVVSVFLVAGSALAQSSNQGTGSGAMMQGGPNASSNPNANAGTGTPHDGKRMEKREGCEKKWTAANAKGTTAGKSEQQYISDCMLAK